MKILRKVLITGMASLIATTSFAACKGANCPSTMTKASKTVEASKASNLINKLLQNRVNIIKQFNAVGNLQGFVLEPKQGPKQKGIIYADKYGRYIVTGGIITADGKNITQLDNQKYIVDAAAPKAFAEAAKTNWFMAGKKSAPHKTYMIVEPNCSACHLAYEKMKPAIDSGQLAVRFIMVAFLRPDSQGKAAAILDAKDQAAAFATDEKGFDMSKESGGATPEKTISAATKAKIQANLKFMQENGFSATPVILFKTTTGKYKSIMGFPNSPQGFKQLIDSMGNTF